MFRNINKIHFIGIGGIGMSSIAEVLYSQGYTISGSDKNLSEVTEHLAELGIKIYEGHSADNIKDVDVVVYSSAVDKNNPEIIKANEKKIPVIKRPAMLAELMRYKQGIGIAGTHGKTTTTSMTGLIFTDAGYDPTIIVGGKLSQLGGTNARSGKSDYIVIEADEYDRTFLKLTPVAAAITTLELEHLDIYKDLEDIKAAFVEYANKIPFYGFVSLCIDEKHLREILPDIKSKVITYGTSRDADIKAVEVKHNGFSSTFNVKYFNEDLGEVKLNVPGIHNVKNSLAAIIIAKEFGIGFEVIKKSLEAFSGVFRRFEVKYNNEILVVDDYAHHPTEVSATLSGIKNGWNRRIIAIFQPHLYTRTKDFADDFGKAFLNSDIFVCTDIYPARETPIEGVTGELIAESAKKYGHKNVIYIKNKNDVPEQLIKLKCADDIIVTMGAGDIWKYNNRFVELLMQSKN